MQVRRMFRIPSSFDDAQSAWQPTLAGRVEDCACCYCCRSAAAAAATVGLLVAASYPSYLSILARLGARCVSI